MYLSICELLINLGIYNLLYVNSLYRKGTADMSMKERKKIVVW